MWASKHKSQDEGHLRKSYLTKVGEQTQDSKALSSALSTKAMTHTF